MFLKSANIDREELLEMMVNNYVLALSRYTNTLLGEPREITEAKGQLFGVCIALGINYEIVDQKIIFRTNTRNKTILELPFEPVDPW